MKINTLIINSSYARTELCDLGVKYPTDKSPYCTENPNMNSVTGHRHPYTAIYDLLFSSLKHKLICVGEIGILHNMSIKCWREYFTNASIYGFDLVEDLINSAIQDNLLGVEYKFLDITDSNSIHSALSGCPKFDILIDDSTHNVEDQIRLINNCHYYMKSGGILIIEDIFMSCPHSIYENGISVSEEFSSISFIIADHANRYSPDWDNDKLLFLVKK